MSNRTPWSHRLVAGATAAVLIVAQFGFPRVAEASHLGSATVSAGSVPPPGVSAVQSFQPDLFTGRATTSIPIAVPPGRKGMQPSLGLAYSSSGRNGWLGVGWSLDLGYIERSTKQGIPKYNASDTYTFMFQGVASELVQIPDGTYRAKDEGLFLKFINTGVSGWEVRDKSGARYFFGRTAASQIEQTGQVFRWALDKIADPNGNTVTVTYAKDQTQLYPSRCDYTGHEPTSLAPANYVEFILEDRPDDEVSYRSGFAVTTTKRLKEIAAYAQGQLARKYVLSYTVSQRTARSLVSGLTQFGADGTTSLPATTFTYQDSGSAGYPNLLNNFQSPPSVSAWNVRRASLDTGHEGFGCANPYQGLPWTSPTVVQGSADLSPLTASVDGSGRLSMSGGQDTFGHGFVYVYTNSPRTIAVSYSHSDVDGCMFREDAGGLQQFPGDTASIPLQAGWSIIHITAYHQHQGWNIAMTPALMSQVDIMNPSQIPLGVPQLAGDANGDAKTDLIKFDPSNGAWTISCATTCTLPPPGTWLTGFGSSSSLPLLGDWNGDGRTDVGIYNSGNWQFATSTGTSFQTGTISSTSFGSGSPLTGDFNGDSIVDLGTYNNGSWSIALGTGSSFASAGSFSLSWGGSGYEPSTGDFNGDGLTDIGLVNASTGAIEVRLSNGNGWTLSAGWIGSFGGSNPHTSADFNGDGLTDAVYYNRSAGQVIYAPSTGSGFSTPVTLPVTFSLTSSDDNIQVGDFNGDGISDPAVFNTLSGSSQLATSSLTNSDGSNGSTPDVLRTIQNGLGGVSTIKYQLTSTCGCDAGAVMPFVLPVVQQVTSSDGLGNSYSTTYLFHDGLYDGPTKEFRGFEDVTVFDAEGNKSVTVFDQTEHKKGRPIRTEFRDASDTLWTKTEQTWTCTEPYIGVHFVKLDQTDAFSYDGDASFKQTRARLTYDAYGNVTRTDEDGEVAVSGDERGATTTFTYDTTGWVLNKPSLSQTLNTAGAVVAQRRFTFDGAGNLTKEEEWRNLPTEAWLATDLTYDAYGNVATVTDALARTTTNTYDAAGTYLTQIANVLGHTRQLAYDARFGAVTGSTDQNGVTTTTQYDTLGRVTKVIGPNDSAALPTISYVYDLSTNPAKTTVSTRIQSGQPDVITAYTFIDGLGRAIQTRVPAEDPTKQVVNGAAEFNTRGLTIKQWAPYLDTASTSYKSHTLVSGLANPVTYTYDPLGRALTVTGPDSSVSTTSYSDGVVTSTDALGHQTRRTSDAHGRLVKVEELNGTSTYTTTYAYDTLGNLLVVTDHAGNANSISYDSLGRKLAMDDPDMGHWAYAYDAVDNLLSQTDARGVATNFTYDQLNRVTQKSYTIPGGSGVANPGTVTYAFDDPAKQFSKGKLTAITDGSGSSGFEYDNLGRLVTESKTLDGATYQIQRSYDLLGRLLTLTYPDGGVASYTYNAQGGIETVAFDSLGTGHTSLVSAVDYNAAGQLTKITYGNGTISDYTYNPQTLLLDQLKTTGPSGTLQDFGYNFDTVGNVTAIQDAVHTATQSFQYDALNRLTTASGAYGSVSYAYDPTGNMTSKEGVTMSYGAGAAGPHAVTSTSAGWQLTYDANGNLIQKKPSSDLLIQNLAYDAENRLVEVEAPQEKTVEVTLQPGWNFFSLPVIPANAAITSVLSNFSTNFEQVSRYGADGSFQHYVGNSQFDDFTQFEYGVGYEVYCKASSPVTVSLTGKLPTQGLSESLTTGWSLLPAIKLEATGVNGVFGGLTYDQALGFAAGSLGTITQVQPSGAYFLHLTQAGTFAPSLPADPSTQFVYDGDGGRVKQIASDGTTRFLGQSYELAPDGKTIRYVFAGSQRIAAIDTPPGQQASLPDQSWLTALADWVFGPSAEAAVLASNIRFYHTDHLGSSNVITNGSGQVVELAENTPFGSLSRHEGSVNVPQKFTGQRSDESTGLYFYNARYYDADLGRFTQADTIVPVQGDPQALNRYSYVRNNPIKYMDPSGHGWFSQYFSTILQVAGVLLAPFTAGQSLWLTYAGIAWSGVQAAQAGQLGAWAVGFAVSAMVGFAIQLPSISNFAMQVGVNAIKGAAIGALSGGFGSLAAGGSFGEGAGYGAIGGAAGGAMAGIATSQQYQNWAAKEGFLSNRQVRAKHYRQDLEQVRALSLNAKDQTAVTVGARAIDGPIKAGHRYAAAQNGNRFEMGPRSGSIVTSNTTDVSTWRTSLTTDSAIAAGLARTTTADVSASGFVTSMGLYEAYFGGQQYSAGSYNSNFAVNSAIYGAGGPEVKNLGFTPEFSGN